MYYSIATPGNAFATSSGSFAEVTIPDGTPSHTHFHSLITTLSKDVIQKDSLVLLSLQRMTSTPSYTGNVFAFGAGYRHRSNKAGLFET
jgi:hypothetical protein